MATAIDAPMCHQCGHFFRDDPQVGIAHTFLYGRHDEPLMAGSLTDDLEEVILDMGNDDPEHAAVALAYALVKQGWPEPEDIQAAVLHHQTHDE